MPQRDAGRSISAQEADFASHIALRTTGVGRTARAGETVRGLELAGGPGQI